MKDELEAKRAVIISWFLQHSCDEFNVYDEDADELLQDLERLGRMYKK